MYSTYTICNENSRDHSFFNRKPKKSGVFQIRILNCGSGSVDFNYILKAKPDPVNHMEKYGSGSLVIFIVLFNEWSGSEIYFNLQILTGYSRGFPISRLYVNQSFFTVGVPERCPSGTPYFLALLALQPLISGS